MPQSYNLGQYEYGQRVVIVRPVPREVGIRARENDLIVPGLTATITRHQTTRDHSLDLGEWYCLAFDGRGFTREWWVPEVCFQALLDDHDDQRPL